MKKWRDFIENDWPHHVTINARDHGYIKGALAILIPLTLGILVVILTKV